MSRSTSPPNPSFDPARLIIGPRALIQALEAGTPLDKVMMQKGLQGEQSREVRNALRHYEIPFQMVPVEKLNRLTRANHQGIVAFQAAVTFGALDEIVQRVYESGASPLVVALDQVTDVRNFGAICRSAECFGAHAVVIPSQGAAQVNEEAMKTSAGALLTLPVCKERSLIAAIERLRKAGLRIIACTEKGATPLPDNPTPLPCCIVLGSEDKGIHPDILKLADDRVYIPMRGNTPSLNVSVAAGIILYSVGSNPNNVNPSAAGSKK